MGVWKTTKRWAGIGALTGLLATAAYGSIDKAYEHLLVEDANGYKITIQNMEKIKKRLPKAGRDSYDDGIVEFKEGLAKAEKRLGDYKKLPETKKKIVAVKDLERYGGILETIKDTKAYWPDSGDDVYKLGKGLFYGALGGGAVGMLKGGVKGTRDWRRGRRDEKIRKELEKQKGKPNNRRH